MEYTDALYRTFAEDHAASLAAAREGFVEKSVMDRKVTELSRANNGLSKELAAT